MGAYVSIPNCESHYQITLNCTVGTKSNSTGNYTTYGGLEQRDFDGDPDVAGVGVSNLWHQVVLLLTPISR
jgi:hypothetical protein